MTPPRRRSRRRLLCLAALPCALALGTGAGATWAHGGHGDAPRLTADPAVLVPGETVVLRGRGFAARAQIVLLAKRPGEAAERVGRARTGPHGGFRAPIDVHAEAAAGAYVAIACSTACEKKATARFRIAEP